MTAHTFDKKNNDAAIFFFNSVFDSLILYYI